MNHVERHRRLADLCRPGASHHPAMFKFLHTHPDLRQTARVRAFMRFVGDALAQRLKTP